MTTATAIDRTSDTASDVRARSAGHFAEVRDRRGGIRDEWIEKKIRRLREEFAPVKQELKDREYHLSPSEKKRRKHKRALARARKRAKQKEYLEFRRRGNDGGSGV